MNSETWKTVAVSDLRVIQELPFAELVGEPGDRWITAKVYEQEFALYCNDRLHRQETRQAWTLWWQDQPLTIENLSRDSKSFPTLENTLVFPDDKSFYAVIRQENGYSEKPADGSIPLS